MLTAAVIVAAGKGVRMGGEVGKQYLPLAGVPILQRTLNAFAASGLFQEIILVVAAAEMDYCRRRVVDEVNTTATIRLIAGGPERQESVFNGLEACSGDAADPVLIHDGVRPFVSKDDLSRCLQTVGTHGACIVAIPSADTLKRVGVDGRIKHTLPREAIWLAQTPQGFRLGLIRAAHRRARRDGFSGTDDAQLLERTGHAVAIVPGSRANIKITTPEDLRLAEAIWQYRTHDAG